MIMQMLNTGHEPGNPIQAGPGFQASMADGLDEVKAAFKSLQDESRQFQELLGAAEQANQDFFSTYYPDVLSMNSGMCDFRSFIRAFFLLPLELEAVIDWKALEDSWKSCLDLARQWRDDQIAPNAQQWLLRLRRLSRPATSIQSAHRVAAHLLVKSFMTPATLSLADIHTLAEAMKGLEPHEIKLPLAFLHSFLCRKRTTSVRENIQLSAAKAVILLRGIELFCDHFDNIGDRLKIAKVFLEIRPLLREARQRSHIIKGLTLYLNDIFSGRKSQSLAIKVHTCVEQKLTLDGKSWFMDGGNLISLDDTVIVYHSSECRLNADRFKGWFIVIETDDQPPWTSSFLDLSQDEAIRKVFPRLLDGLEQGNPPIPEA